MGMRKQDKYALFRACGYGARQAAREAGYAHGTPSEAARAMWDDVEDLLKDMDGEHLQALLDSQDEIRERIAEQQRVLRLIELLNEAKRHGRIVVAATV